jgi:hypothetical protein
MRRALAITRWYSSKIDWWPAILLALAPLACVLAMVGACFAGNGFVPALGGALFLAAIYAGLVFPMRYGIDDEHVVVQHGLVRQRIPLRDIIEVSPTRNPVSAPALSLDRLEIRFGRGYFKSAMISPVATADFLAELAERAGLRRDGSRLVREVPTDSLGT